MVKTADSRWRQRLTPLGRVRLNRTVSRRLLLQSNVSSVLMVINQILAPEASQVLFIQRNDMIQHLATAAADPALGHSVGEGRQLHRMTTMPIPLLKSSTHTIR